MSYIAASKSTQFDIFMTASSQPKISIVREMIEGNADGFNPHKIRLLGGLSNFSQLITTCVGHSGGVNSVCISRDGTKIVSGSGDCTVKVN